MGTHFSFPKGAQPQFSAHICCGQMSGWIKMPLGMEIGLGQVDYVLDGDPAPSPQKFSAHVYCGQTAGWIKMALSMEVGLGSGHIVLHGDTAALSKKGQSPPSFGPFYCTLYRGRPRPTRHCIRWGPSSPPLKGHGPQFSANVCCGQTAGWYGGRRLFV